MNRRRLCQFTATIWTSMRIVGFMKRHSDYHATINYSYYYYTSAELTQFDGRARGDDVMGNLTVSKLRASQVTVGMLAYRCCADS